MRLYPHHLAELCAFNGDHEMASADQERQGHFDALHKMGLLSLRVADGEGLRYWYRATPLGLRVIHAAVRAANEELAK